jgi:hypothetical protein
MIRSALVWAAAAAVTVAGSASAQDVALVQGDWYTPNTADFLAGLPGVNVTVIDSYDANSLSAYNYVVHYGNSFYDQAALESFISAGGTLIATPWMVNNNNWNSSPASPMESYNFEAQYSAPLTANVLDPNDQYLAGVTFNNGDLVGYEGGSTAKDGAIVPVVHGDNSPLLAYMDYNAGRSVYVNLHYVTSDCSLAIDYAWGQQLLANIVSSRSCYADFDKNSILDLFDFLAYVNAFNDLKASADCDENGEFDLFDFLCFTNAFNAGCD